MEFLNPNKEKQVRLIFIIVSIVIPVVVAALFKISIEGVDLSFLPPFYAGLNAATAMLLISALVAIKKQNQKLHRLLMRFALLLSLLFLVCYVAYHLTSAPTIFGDTNHNGILENSEKLDAGSSRYIYVLLLLSHILLSVAVIPMVLFTYLNAWKGDFVKHKKLARISFPIWLYVAITGVIVYFMIAPYYS